MKDIIRTIPAKVLMFLMICVTSVICIISVCVALFGYQGDLYNRSLADIMEEEKSNYAYNASEQMLYETLQNMPNIKLAYHDGNDKLIVENGQSNENEDEVEPSDVEEATTETEVIIENEDEVEPSDLEEETTETEQLNGNNDEYELLEDCGAYNWNNIPDNYFYCITDINGKVISESENFNNSEVKYTYYLVKNNDLVIAWNTENTQKKIPDATEQYITIKGYFEGGVPDLKKYKTHMYVYEKIYGFLGDAIPAAVISGLVTLILYITLMCVSARRPKSDDLFPGYSNKIPYDVILAVDCIIVALLSYFTGYVIDEDITGIILIGFDLICMISIFLGLSMETAARIKEGTLITNTICYRLCKWCWKLFKKYVLGLIKWFFKKIRTFFANIREIFNKLPLIWKTVVGFGAISLIEIFVIGCTWYEMDNYIICWFFGHIILFVVICRFALGLRGLQAAGRALATGDYEHRVDTSKLHFDFKEHGENLNHISDGMITAVEEKMKSERMKTELITNVSHDIKTPLTSIINYTDLIGKEETDNEKIKEYTEVLLRQSERLKRLIEDLVEASKASTGNLEVELAPCETSMFITQIAGEYEEKFNNAGLTLVTKGFDNSAYIMADGRRMLRVFDNLMNNICKYALENSRVYLSLDVSEQSEAGDDCEVAIITFKNTSRNELDMSPEELIERFVRGDKSRNTEGNGLGLSIARSLTELQGGSFDIKIDGDLFKVVLTFPKIK